MSRYPNPCDRCTRASCKYQECQEYLKRVRTIWKQFNGYTARSYKAKSNMKREKFIYEHPDLIRRYLQEGPCKKCRTDDNCDTPCGAYLRWWDARMEWLRWVYNGADRSV